MEKLLKIIEEEKIMLKYMDFSVFPEAINGLYLYEPDIGPVIVLGSHLQRSQRLFNCVLAEEIGHFYTVPRGNLLMAYKSGNLKAINSQDEHKAMRWATDFLIPDTELSYALAAGCHSCFDLAEYFNVTEWFMVKKLDLVSLDSGRLSAIACCREPDSIPLQRNTVN